MWADADGPKTGGGAAHVRVEVVRRLLLGDAVVRDIHAPAVVLWHHTNQCAAPRWGWGWGWAVSGCVRLHSALAESLAYAAEVTHRKRAVNAGLTRPSMPSMPGHGARLVRAPEGLEERA